MKTLDPADRLSLYGSPIVRRTNPIPDASQGTASVPSSELRVRSPVDGFILAMAISLAMWAALVAGGLAIWSVV